MVASPAHRSLWHQILSLVTTLSAGLVLQF
jgi:hypothetical protein